MDESRACGCDAMARMLSRYARWRATPDESARKPESQVTGGARRNRLAPSRRAPSDDEHARGESLDADSATPISLPAPRSRGGRTALHEAAARGALHDVLALLRAGADPCARDDAGRNATHHAAATADDADRRGPPRRRRRGHGPRASRRHRRRPRGARGCVREGARTVHPTVGRARSRRSSTGGSVSRRRRGGDVSAAEGAKSRETTKTRGRDPATGSEQSIVHETGRVGATRGGRAKTRGGVARGRRRASRRARARHLARRRRHRGKLTSLPPPNDHDEERDRCHQLRRSGHDENGRANATLSNRARSAADRLRLLLGRTDELWLGCGCVAAVGRGRSRGARRRAFECCHSRDSIRRVPCWSRLCGMCEELIERLFAALKEEEGTRRKAWRPEAALIASRFFPPLRGWHRPSISRG